MIGDLLPSDPFACWVGIQLTRMGLDEDHWPILERVATLVPPFRSVGVFACMGTDCNCIFWPDIDGLGPDAYVYVDRWQPARRGSDGPYGCEQPNCECHLLVHLGDDNRHVLDEIIQPRIDEGGQPGASDPALPVA